MPSRVGLAVGVLVVGVSVLLAVPSHAYSGSGGQHVVFKSETNTSFTHNQGVARVSGGWILTGTDKPLLLTDNIARMTNTLTPVLTIPAAIPPQWRNQGYDHIGDIDIWHGLIYAPFEQPDYSKGEQVTATYDARTLVYQDGWVVHQHENSFVTIDPQTGIAYSMQHSNGWCLTRNDAANDWKHLHPLCMSRKLFHTQGADVARGYIWISTSDKHNDLWRVDKHTGQVDHLGTHQHPGGEGEGIDATVLPSGDLHALILDKNPGQGIWFENFGLAPDRTTTGQQGDRGSRQPTGAGTAGTPGGSSSKSSGRLATTGAAGRLVWLAITVVALATIGARRLRRFS